jgi:hypothetical protein
MMVFLSAFVVSGISATRFVGKEVTPLLNSSHHFHHSVGCTAGRNCKSTNVVLKILRYFIPIFCANILGRYRKNYYAYQRFRFIFCTLSTEGTGDVYLNPWQGV